jgi:hypothetical protein
MYVEEPEVPIFDPSRLADLSKDLPFITSYPGDDQLTIQGRDEILNEINCYSKTLQAKYIPIIISASPGMGKSFLLRSVGLQRVPEMYKNRRIQEALDTGRVLSFDFAKSLESVPKSIKEVRQFPGLLMIFFLCRLFNGTNVNGIHFEEIPNFSQVKQFRGKQKEFNDWLCRFRESTTSEMVKEYIILTNSAFQVEHQASPVFVLDGVQHLCQETSFMSWHPSSKVYHTLLSFLFLELAIYEQPICICAGTSDGKIMDIDCNVYIPLVFSPRALESADEYITFWNEMTDFRNRENQGGTNVEFVFQNSGSADDKFFESLVYTSHQVPRLLYIAHGVWYDYQLHKLGSREAHHQQFQDKARQYFDRDG